MTAMNKGDANCTTGAALTAYTSLVTNPDAGFSATLTADQTKAIKAQAWAMVQVLDEIVAHGVAYIPTAQGALQRVGTTDTDPPAAEREIRLR